MPSALSIHWHTLLEEDPVAYIVVLPNCQEDEVTRQEPLENLVRSSSAERRVLTVLAMEAFEHLNTQDKGERLTEAEGHLSSTSVAGEVAGKSSNTQWAFRQPSRPLSFFVYTSHDDYKLDRKCEGVASNVSSTTWDLRPLPHWMVIFSIGEFFWRMCPSRAGKRAWMAPVGSHSDRRV